MARVTDVAIRRATLIQRLEELAQSTDLEELRVLGGALTALDDDEASAQMADAVRATALRLASAMSEGDREQALQFARREAIEQVALVLPEWVARIVEQRVPPTRSQQVIGSPRLLEQVAQELEAPTEALETAVQHLRRLELELEADRAAASVTAAAESLRLLLNDLLDLASLGDGRFAAARITFGVRDCVVAALDGLRPRATRVGARLVPEIDDNVPDALIGDPGRLRQVLHTLAGNAIDGGDGVEGVEVRVHVSAAIQGQDVTLHAAVRARTQATQRSAGRRDSGAWVWRGGARTGLGLSIARQLVEQMGGRTWVGNDADGRSEIHFEVALGLPPAQLAATPGTRAPLDLRVLLCAPGTEPVDEVLVQLDDLGTMVVPCSSIASARSRMRETQIDVILIAGSFATREGSRWIEDAARLGGDDGPPSVLMVRRGHRGDAARCRSLGISAYLSRPCTSRDLRDTLRVVGGSVDTAGRRHSHTGRGSLVTRHFLRESRRRLQVGLRAAGPSALGARLIAMGHGVEMHGTSLDVDLVLIDATALGDRARDWVEATCADLMGPSRPPVLAVLAPEAAQYGLPQRVPVDEIVVAPVSDAVLAGALPRLRSHRDEANGSAAEPYDLREIAERVGGDVAVARILLRALQTSMPSLRRDITEALAREDLIEACNGARALGSAMGHLGWRAPATQALELAERCRSGDLNQALQSSAELWGRVRHVMAAIAATLDSDPALVQDGAGPRPVRL